MRSKADEGYTSMRAGPGGEEHTIEAKLEKAAALWGGGAPHEPSPAESLAPVTSRRWPTRGGG